MQLVHYNVRINSGHNYKNILILTLSLILSITIILTL